MQLGGTSGYWYEEAAFQLLDTNSNIAAIHQAASVNQTQVKQWCAFLFCA